MKTIWDELREEGYTVRKEVSRLTPVPSYIPGENFYSINARIWNIKSPSEVEYVLDKIGSQFNIAGHEVELIGGDLVLDLWWELPTTEEDRLRDIGERLR